MFEYRQVLTRMRLGDTDRAIARVGLMGRRKVAQLRGTAEAAGWLDVATPLPGDPELAVHLGSVRTQPAVASLAEPHRERITRWWRQGVQGTTIHGALVRSHGFTGSYSSVRRFLAGLEAAHPQVTTVLEFDPGEAAQVDFGNPGTATGQRQYQHRLFPGWLGELPLPRLCRPSACTLGRTRGQPCRDRRHAAARRAPAARCARRGRRSVRPGSARQLDAAARRRRRIGFRTGQAVGGAAARTCGGERPADQSGNGFRGEPAAARTLPRPRAPTISASAPKPSPRRCRSCSRRG